MVAIVVGVGNYAKSSETEGNKQRYKLWCSGDRRVVGEVGIILKEEICEKVVEV